MSESVKSMLKSLEALGVMAEQCAPDMALAVHAELGRTIAAGTDPYGEKWQLTQEGKVPLRNALKAVKVTALGPRIYVVVSGVEAKHHLGAVTGKIKRRIIPSKKRIPDGMALAMRQVLDRYFIAEVKHAG